MGVEMTVFGQPRSQSFLLPVHGNEVEFLVWKWGQNLKKRAAYPDQEFSSVPPTEDDTC